MKVTRFLFIIIGAIVLTACQQQNESTAENDKLEVYTSIYPIQYAAEKIAGDYASVEPLFPPGVDAHTYEPSIKDITKVARADAFIFLGAGMEGFSADIENTLQAEDISLIEIGADKELFHKSHETEAHEDEHGHSHSDLDPHIWLDPLRMIDIGKLITEELIALNPEHEEAFKDNLDSFITSMKELDHTYSEKLSNKQDPVILVSHAAYGYWDERYGVEQIAISGLSSSDEPSQKDLAQIARIAKENNMHYVIFEANGSNQIAEIVREHIGAEKLEIHSLESLTDADVKNGEDYLSLMNKNADVLDKATK